LELLSFNKISYEQLEKIWPNINKLDQEIRRQIEIEAVYSVFMDKHLSDILSFKKDEKIKIPKDFDYFSPKLSLSNEVRAKLDFVRPFSLGAASRISGVTPAALAAIIVALRSKKINRAKNYEAVN
jgi:tRNA uridine 5-carboxymethylaminomethyl modification enzyme